MINSSKTMCSALNSTNIILITNNRKGENLMSVRKETRNIETFFKHINRMEEVLLLVNTKLSPKLSI